MEDITWWKFSMGAGGIIWLFGWVVQRLLYSNYREMTKASKVDLAEGGPFAVQTLETKWWVRVLFGYLPKNGPIVVGPACIQVTGFLVVLWGVLLDLLMPTVTTGGFILMLLGMLMLVLLVSIVRQRAFPKRCLRMGESAPAFVLPLLGGGEISLANLRGQVVVIHFWATWAIPSRQEIQILEELWQIYRDKGAIFIGVDYCDVESEALALLSDFGVTYPNGLDEEGKFGNLYHISTLPTALVIDRSGRIANVYNGLKEGKLTAQLDRLLR